MGKRNTTGELQLYPHWEPLERAGVVTYDRLGFSGFLERLGTSEDELLQALKNDDDPDRRLSYYQEWLFFGTLHEFENICPRVFSLDEIVYKTTGNPAAQFVSFRKLVHLFKRFCTELTKDGVPEDRTNGNVSKPRTFANVSPAVLASIQDSGTCRIHNENREHFSSIVTQALNAMDRLHGEIALKWKIDVTSYLRYNPRLLVSIHILLETLKTVHEYLSGRDASKPAPKLNFPLTTTYISQEMRNRGWCPSRTKPILFQPYGSCSINYLLSLLPTFDSRDHSRCRVVSCVFANETGKQLNSKLHLESSHIQQRVVNLITPVVEQILGTDSFPVIRSKSKGPVHAFKQRLLGEWPFEIVPHHSTTPFMAVSHVWAHGLGNPMANFLPLPQMDRLRGYSERIGLSHFWIDTICVPVEGESKLRGIAKLREVYSKASVVLVIDAGLTQITVSCMLEAKMQFLCCEWFSRLWTLQEGWLASDLRVQFRNVTLSVTELLDTFGPASMYPGRGGLDNELYNQLQPYFDKSTDALTLISLQRAMHGRSVTKDSDEPICIATLLNLDFEIFAPDPPTMKKIFETAELSEGILWAEAPRLPEKGFGWAPSTLLKQYGNSRVLDTQQDPEVQRTCCQTSEGLRTRQAFWMLEDDLDLSHVAESTVSGEGDTQPTVRLSIFDPDGHDRLILRTPQTLHGKQSLLGKCYKRPCIIVGSFAKENGEVFPLGLSILMENVTERNGVFYGHYVTSFREMKASMVETYTEDIKLDIRGKFCAERLDWCID